MQERGVMKLVTYLRGPLLKNAFFLALNMGLTSALGALFWFLAAKLYPPEEVGLATTLIAVVTLLGVLTSFGIGMSLMIFLPSAGPSAGAMINTGLTLGAITSAIGALIFLGGLPLWSPALNPVLLQPLNATIFLCAVVTWMLFSLQDDILTTYRATQLLAARSLVLNLMRVILAVTFVSLGGIGLFSSILITQAIGVLVAVLILFPHLQADYVPRPSLDHQILVRFKESAFGHYTADTLNWLPSTLFPVLVANRLSVAHSAYLYVPLMINGIVNIVPGMLSTSLVVEGARTTAGFARKIKWCFLLSASLLVPTIMVIWFFGERILGLFGENYSRHSSDLLVILSLSSIPAAINVFYTAHERVHGNLNRLTVVILIKIVVILAGGYMLIGKMGIGGIGIAILIGNSTAAILGLVLPLIGKLNRLTAC